MVDKLPFPQLVSSPRISEPSTVGLLKVTTLEASQILFAKLLQSDPNLGFVASNLGPIKGSRMEEAGMFLVFCFRQASCLVNMDVSKYRGGPPKWMVYNGKPY